MVISFKTVSSYAWPESSSVNFEMTHIGVLGSFKLQQIFKDMEEEIQLLIN